MHLHSLTRWLVLLLYILVFFLTSCSSSSATQQVANHQPPPKGNKKYDVAELNGDYQHAFDDLISPVKLLYVVTNYYRYSFPREAGVITSHISDELISAYSHTRFVDQESTVGTATIIYRDASRFAVLTCAHTLLSPDTLFEYYPVEAAGGRARVKAVAVRISQRNTLTDMQTGKELEILAIDADLDVAILGKEYDRAEEVDIPVFGYPVGSAKQLDWGALVYMVGYPTGKKMLTRGLVSSPNRNRNGAFLIDALFNRGFSGGIVLAVRDGLPNFELVGMVNAVAAESAVVLLPYGKVPEDIVDTPDPYEDAIYLRNQKRIQYGVTFAIPIEEILVFMNRNREYFERRGYNSELFFKSK